MHKACVHPSITPPLGVFFLSFLLCGYISRRQGGEIKVRSASMWSCRRINFHTLVVPNALTVSENVALSKPGNVWLVKTYMPCLYGALSLHSRGPHLTHGPHTLQTVQGEIGQVLNLRVKFVHIVNVWADEFLIKKTNGKSSKREKKGEWISIITA